MKILLRLLSVLLAFALGSAGAAAQVVRGELRDDERGRAIAGARLLLLTEDGATVDSTTSDPAGGFRLRAPGAGSHLVHFQLDGWATAVSRQLDLQVGGVVDLDFRVPLIASAALREMSDIISMEPRLQAALPELCGEAFRPWEAGLLIGRVRSRSTGEPVSGVRVAVASAHGGGSVRATVSGDNGVYVLCNVPVGPRVQILTETPQGAADTTRVEIRAGSAAWYDLMVGSRPR